MASTDYASFLAAKAQADGGDGFEPLWMPDMLFPFQAHLTGWAIRQGRGALLEDCGLGKSGQELTWAQNVYQHTGKPVLLLAPLAVTFQMAGEAQKFGVDAEVSRGGKVPAGVTITNYERLEHFDPAAFGGLVCDECFAPDTLIDTPSGRKRIKDVKIGEAIINAAGIDTVADVHRREVPYAVRVTIAGRPILSSPNHPFFTRRGWVGAQDLIPGDEAVATAQAVRMVRGNVRCALRAGGEEAVLRSILLSEMADEQSGTQGQGAHAGGGGEAGGRQAGLVRVRHSRGRGGAGAHPRHEPDRRPGCPREDLPHIESHEPRTFRAWGQWPGLDRSAAASAGCTWTELAGGVRHITGPLGTWLSDALQTRLGAARAANRHRAGWSLPPQPPRSGREERREAGFARVDGVEVLESGDPRLAGLRDADGRLYFYDLGATRHPSFSVAGNLVHNSSAIKSFDGARRAMVTEFARTVPYRLLGTATAAPNNTVELGTSSEALGYLGYQDMIARFFTNKERTGTSRGGRWRPAAGEEWRFRGHAEDSFWRWVSSWARACRRPSDLGFDDTGFTLPPLDVHRHVVEARTPQAGALFDVPVTGLHAEREETRRTLTERCELAAALLADARPGVAWCQLNDESRLLTRLIDGAVELTGAASPDEKETILAAFSRGEIRVLVTKPSLGAWGLNWQHCHRMTYFPSHCYDEHTEVLTRAGWKTFGKVSLDDDLATVNPETLGFEWQAPSRVVWEHYSGPMLHFAGQRNFDLMVTPNHNLFVQRCPVRFPGDGSPWHLRHASNIADRFRRQEYRMLSAPSSADGNRPDWIEVPQHGPRYYRSRTLRPISAEDFMRLAGWYLSEGHARPVPGKHAGQITISQSDHNPEYRAEIIALLARLGLPVYHKTKDIRVSNVDLAALLIGQFGSGSYVKRIPRWVKDLHPDLLIILRDTMMKGDGSALRTYYKSFSQQLRDDFQEICLRTGVRASVHNDYVSLAWKSLRPAIHRKPVTVDYDGMVGCATVPNHTLIVRRNGIPVVSGNSFEQWYQAVRRSWRFGQQHAVTVDVLTTTGAANVFRNLERKAAQADQMFDSLTRHMREAQAVPRAETYEQEAQVPAWAAS